jgi:hypothetical protein
MFLYNALYATLNPKTHWRSSRPLCRHLDRRLHLEALEDRALPSGLISLTPSEAAPQLVGDPITWTATVADAPPGLVYQFSVKAPHAAYQVVRDFSPDDHFTWAPMREGNYRIKVTVKDGFDATDTQSDVVKDEVDSRVTGVDAVVSPTSNPLVALFSVPSGPKGMVHVEFAVASATPSWRSTDELPSKPGKSTNFLVAGMLPKTTYEMRYVRSDGTTSSPLLFATGAIPASVVFPPITVVQPPGNGSDLNQDMLLQILGRAAKNGPYVYATNLAGQVIWYYDAAQSGFLPNNPAQGATLLAGGTVLVMGGDSHSTLPMSRNVLREIDLAGNPLRETNLAAVHAQLTAMGHEVIYSFTHDAQRLPNGNTVVLGLTERTADIDGNPTKYVGTMIVVLDKNFQVTWAWDAFDYLDVNRGPVLGEVLQPGATEPTAAVPILPAVDWLHTNSINWSPSDQNLVVSLRHQDWVIKIDYENGAGDGHIMWRLGQGGDFTVNSADPNPWFSHQHNAHYIDDNTLILFDNGNTRRTSDPTADSRGQVWKLDEQTMTATLVVNVDLGNYSDRVGSAQVLSNGNYVFTSGAQGTVGHFIGQSIEVLPDGSKTYVQQVGTALYRSFRVQTLYEGTALAPTVQSVVINDGSAQRSMVTSLTVTFSTIVTLDPHAFELVRQEGGVIQITIAQAVVDGHSVDTLSFKGAGIIGGSLADGHYTLTIDGDRVHDGFGQALDGAGTGVGGTDRVDTFFRLFGDSNGDGKVDLVDLGSFASTLGKNAGDPGYLWYFDYYGDGRVDIADLLQLLSRLGG